jgi:micrococcal nuclease
MPATLGAAFLAMVVSVHDGDTLRVRTDTGQLQSIRIAGIDAPELRQDWGRVSGRSLRTLCLGKRATVRPSTVDRYQRLVAHVQCGRTDASRYQVERGMAWVFVRYEPAGSPLYHWQARAQHYNRGLWSQQSPQPPWAWRHSTNKYLN